MGTNNPKGIKAMDFLWPWFMKFTTTMDIGIIRGAMQVVYLVKWYEVKPIREGAEEAII